MSLLTLFLSLLLASICYITLWFVLARLADRADVVDIAWGLGFVYVSWLAWLLMNKPTGLPLVVVGFVTIWGLRLAIHIATRNIRKSEDHRYVVYRRQWEPHFWEMAYVRIFLVQGVLLLTICSTAVASIAADRPAVKGVAALGFMAWAIGIVYEAVADYQLRVFVRTKQPGDIMQRGLWRNSRHPNYFGEILSWLGAAIVGLSLQQWWAVIGAAVITLLITKVSGVPLLEQHYADNPKFQAYKKHTSILIPLPRR